MLVDSVIEPDPTPVGYTVGNDLSCRDLEGENPLYLMENRFSSISMREAGWAVPRDGHAGAAGHRIGPFPGDSGRRIYPANNRADPILTEAGRQLHSALRPSEVG